LPAAHGCCSYILDVGTELRTIYVRNEVVFGLRTRCAVVQDSPLLRELLLAVMHLPALRFEIRRASPQTLPHMRK
jgi:hypothetical protein